jgi:hypothetical protein
LRAFANFHQLGQFAETPACVAFCLPWRRLSRGLICYYFRSTMRPYYLDIQLILI